MKCKITTGEILYWLFFGSILFAKGIGLYDGQPVFKLILIFAGMCLLAKLLIEKYTILELLKIIAVVGITGFTYAVSGEKGMLLYGLMMVGMKYVDTKKLFAVGTVLWTIAFLGVTIISFFHMEDTVYKVHSKLGMGHIFRWSLGYPHPNVLQVSYLILAIFIIYVLGDKFKLKHAFFLFAGNLFFFLYSVSYTGFAVFMCLLIGRIYLMLRKKINFAEKLLLQMIFPACVFASLVAPVTITGKAFQVLNQLLSTRMELAWRYLKPEYMSLFGVRLSEITTESITMDNAYLSAFITYGAIPFLILCVAIMYMIYKYLRQDKYLEVLIMVVIIVGGLTEPFLFNTSFKNLFFIFMGTLLFEQKEDCVERCIVPLAKINLMNKTAIISLEKIEKIIGGVRKILSFSLKKCIAGVAGAVIVLVASNMVISYPAGYVVYRVDCADLTKNKNYYDEKNPAYADFRKMEDFEAGEEIEYFSENIVKMEHIRNDVKYIVFGYAVTYFWGALLLKKRENSIG